MGGGEVGAGRGGGATIGLNLKACNFKTVRTACIAKMADIKMASIFLAELRT